MCVCIWVCVGVRTGGVESAGSPPIQSSGWRGLVFEGLREVGGRG